MIKKIFATKKSIVYTSLISAGVLALILLVVFTATASDSRRLVYRETKDGTYVVEDIKNIYRGGIFFKDTLEIPAEYRGEKVVSIERVDASLIKEIVIEDGIKEIKASAFTGLSGLEKVTIPQSVTKIESSAFSNCSNLREVVFEGQSKLESLGNKAFSNCKKLTTINLPTSIKSVGDEAFKDCLLLETINLDLKKVEIGGSVFKGTKYADEIMKNNNGFMVLEGILFDFNPEYYSQKVDNKIENIVIPENVNVINKSAFAEVTNIEAVTLNEAVTEVGANAFENCTGLKVVYFSTTAVKIKEKAFYGCNNLKVNVYLSEEVEETVLDRLGKSNNEFKKARSVFEENGSYYTYVFLTSSDKTNDVKTKLSFDLESFEIFRMNGDVKEVFDQNKYEFTEKE